MKGVFMKILTTKVTGQELAESNNIFDGPMTKGVVDVSRRLLAIDAPMHANPEIIKGIVVEWIASRFQGAFDRALELFDFTIESLQRRKASAELGEVCRAREEFCDYFNGNSMKTDPVKMQKYYDEFAILARN